MFYQIIEKLEQCEAEQIRQQKRPYVALLTTQEWKNCKNEFDMGIDIEPELTEIYTTKAEVNYDSLTGTFCVPDRQNLSGQQHLFSFALDEKGIVFIDDGEYVSRVLAQIQQTKKWRFPSLERFLYDFLDHLVKDDLYMMQQYERELDGMEQAILQEENDTVMLERVNEIRGEIRDMQIHYEQLMDLAQELIENENHFFEQENLRYFRLFLDRVTRLQDTSASVRDYTLQIRDLHKTHLDLKQNRIMTILTVVTTIFMPLTLIAGWYGMNFSHMPELESRWGYPGVILFSIVVVIASLLFFQKKKWL